MRNRKKIFSLRALIFAVLVTAAVSTVTLSRYMTTVTGTATASIAQFEVELAPAADANTDLSFTGSNYKDTQVQEYQFTVTSHSDVAMTYTLAVGFGDEYTDITLWIDNVELTYDETTKMYKCATVFDYELADTEPKTHTLKIQVGFGDGTKGEQNGDFNFESVTVQVTAQQK